MIPSQWRGFLQNIEGYNAGPMGTLADILNQVCVGHELRDDALILVFENGAVMKMHHQQQCCESVWLEDINGDLDDLLNTPLLVCDERVNTVATKKKEGTWTFYTLRSLKGSIDLRWFGTSNGYYSEKAEIDVHLPKTPLTAEEAHYLQDHPS